MKITQSMKEIKHGRTTITFKLKSDEKDEFKVLEKSRLLKGINNYRFSMFEANPNTFVLPRHFDVEAIYFVTNERGSVVRIPTESTVYMVNQDNKEKLNITMLALPVNTLDKFETPREKLFDGQKGQYGVFKKAKPQQIRAMSQQAISPRKRGGERLAFNILNQSPVYSNRRFFEASHEDFK
ncbi:hypothetical protein REPUB_Repub20aG0085400 [Reevesia pubescens]